MVFEGEKGGSEVYAAMAVIITLVVYPYLPLYILIFVSRGGHNGRGKKMRWQKMESYSGLDRCATKNKAAASSNEQCFK